MCGIQLARSTAHHPAANGLVERFHRTMKAAIMCHADQQWRDALPFVLLGIRTAYKEDVQATVAELVYGEPLRIPGELRSPTAEPVDPAHLITEPRKHIARLRPVPAARHTSPSTFVHRDLERCTHVFLCQDTTRRALEPPLQRPLPGPVTESEDSATSRVREVCHCVNGQGQAGLHPKRDPDIPHYNFACGSVWV
jgi:cleavage and polyadenylation specificity factor subunit 1